jgi:hypothetical protein
LHETRKVVTATRRITNNTAVALKNLFLMGSSLSIFL